MSDREFRRLRLVAHVTAALEAARLGWPDEGRVLAEMMTWRSGKRTSIRVYHDGAVTEIEGRCDDNRDANRR